MAEYPLDPHHVEPAGLRREVAQAGGRVLATRGAQPLPCLGLGLEPRLGLGLEQVVRIITKNKNGGTSHV